MNLQEIGTRIKVCRQKKNWTQEKFAEIIDVSPHYIYEIERGSKAMSLHTLDKVSSSLETSPDYIIYGTHQYTSDNINLELPDKLSLVTDIVPPGKRDSIAEIIKTILPYIK